MCWNCIDKQLIYTGGKHGVRDEGLLESSIPTPQRTFGGNYLYQTLAEMAAAYWHSLTMNHVFLDRNKRIGLRTADVFLSLNGFNLDMSAQQAVKVTLQLTSHEIDREELALVLETHVKVL